MKTYLFTTPKNLHRTGILQKDIFHVLQKVAENTDTQDLVVSLYLLPGRYENRGTAYVRDWLIPNNFITKRGKWSITSQWALPSDLPQRFKLIRLRLDGNQNLFPRTEEDRYGWVFRYASFQDHLATLFAHELHHYRRFHLNLHPREGEHSANLWALQHVKELGFHIEGKKVRQKQRRKNSNKFFLGKFPKLDPFSRFRKLPSGTQLVIKHDPKGRYLGQKVTIVRPIRSNSNRMVVQTHDGIIWRWPMNWLDICNDNNFRPEQF